MRKAAILPRTTLGTSSIKTGAGSQQLSLMVIATCMSIAALLPLFLDSYIPATGTQQAASFWWSRFLPSVYLVTLLSIGVACVSLAVLLQRLAKAAGSRTRLPFAVAAFGVLIAFTGLTSIGGTMTGWAALSVFSAALKYLTAICSVGMALTLPRFISKILTLITSSRAAHAGQEAAEKTAHELLGANESLRLEIVDRMAAQAQASLHLQRLQTIIDTLPMGALAMDENHRILRINQQAFVTLGLEGDCTEMIGKPGTVFFERMQSIAANPETYAEEIRAFMAGETEFTNTEFELKDGRVIRRDRQPILLNGEPKGYLLIYRDVTREKRIDTAKSEFMSLASHQLRTPLTAIRWSLGRLSRSAGETLAPEDRRLLNEGRIAASRMAHTIDTMLAISRIEAGQIHLEEEEMKLGLLLNDVRVDCRELYEARKQSFHLECPPNLVLHTDAHILKEIVQNLYSNAIKYTPPGGSIHVRASLRGALLRIDVEDTGHGIPTHQQQKIFRKFFRGDNILATDTEGTGLGLYLVALLVQMLGGSISFVSQEGSGTTFTLLLPANK